jgi:hypothetical protein
MAQTYKITLISLNSATNTANIDIQLNGGSITHITNVAGLPMATGTPTAQFIAAGEKYAIDYYNGQQAVALPAIDPAITALVGQSASVVV